MSTETVSDIRIPQRCPHCLKRYDWKLSPDEAREWANALLAHLDGFPVSDGRRLAERGRGRDDV